MVPLEVISAAEMATAAGPTWSVFLAAILGSSVVGAAVSTLLSNVNAAAATRREHYAKVHKVLIRRVEFAYRVRRRVSDDPEVLAELSRLGSDIQEDLAWCLAWVTTESTAVARVLSEVCDAINHEVGPATCEAWNLPPTSGPAGMNLGDWGPRNHREPLAKLQNEIRFRFGWRRAVPHRLRWWWRSVRRKE